MVKLYGYWRSSATWRVRLGLQLKGLSYDIVPVHLVRDGGEQKQAAHLARNPMGQVPVLELDDGGERIRLVQSVAILEYVEERWPTPSLLPSTAAGRAHCRALVEVVNSGIQPLQNLGVLGQVRALGGDSDAWAAAQIRRGLDALEALAAPGAGTFLCGDHVTLADVFLVPQLYNATRFGLEVAAWPTLDRVGAACSVLAPFLAAHPDRQPDAVA